MSVQRVDTPSPIPGQSTMLWHCYGLIATLVLFAPALTMTL